MAGLIRRPTAASNNTPAVGSVRIQQSTYGLTIPIVWGRTRITGNLIWYGDFQAIPHKEVTQSGGKGGAGGVKPSTTTYTYEAAVMMALAEGPLLGVRAAWRGKNVYFGAAISSQTVKTYENPTYAGSPITVANTNQFKDVSAEYYNDGMWLPLKRGTDYTASSGGVYTFTGVTNGTILQLTYTYVENTASQSALGELGLDLMAGYPAQAAWSYLTTNHPTEAIGYSSIAYVYGSNYELTGQAEVDNHAFEVDASLQFSDTIPDANPAPVLQDFLNNPQYGAGFGAERVGDLSGYMDACTAQGLFVSPCLSDQRPAIDFVRDLADITNAGVVWSEGALKIIPRTDQPITGNGVTYTPNTSPIYDLTDDDFMGDPGEGPVRVLRKSHADTFNTVKVEFLDREHAYNISIVEAKDQADIQETGVRAMNTIQAHWICDRDVARNVAQLILQRALFIRNTYEFTLGWSKIGLEPMDLVTLTDSGLGLSLQPVRILSIDESQDGFLSVVAEEFPKGSASATLYPTTSGSGFYHNYNESPGNAYDPIIFEAPAPMSSSSEGLEIWLATGGGDDFGGCEIWTSLTGTDYQRAATFQGKSRYGTLTTALSSHTSSGVYADIFDVALTAGGQIMPGSHDDMVSLTTLCYVGGEFLSYENAYLLGVDSYRLGPSLNRGGYHSGQPSHAIGTPFVRCDENVAKLPLTADYIGKTIYIKILAFNVYKGGLQSLADVTEYTYTITGAQANVAPPAPANLALEGAFTINTAKFKWDPSPRAGTYNVQIWAGSPLAKKREVNVGDALRYDYSFADAKTDGGPWRDITIKVQGVNLNGAAGAFSTLAATNPQIGGLTGPAVTGGPGAVVFNCAKPADADFSGIQVWLGTSSGFTPGPTNLVYDGPSTTVTIPADASGAALSPGTNYYLKFTGYDNFDKLGTTIGSLGPVQIGGPGIQTGTARMYQWAFSQPSNPSGTSTWTWATGANSAYTGGDGWTVTIPTNPGTANLELWEATVSVTSNAGVASTTVAYGSASVKSISKNGSNGTTGPAGPSGYQTAYAYAYQWALSTPTSTGSSLWTWVSSSYSSLPSGSWTLNPGSPPGAGWTLYRAAVLLNDTATASTTSFNWASAGISPISTSGTNGSNGTNGTNGTNGSNGNSAVIGYSLVDAAQTPLATSPSTYTTSGTAYPPTGTWGETRAWQATSPTPTAGQSVYQIDGIYNPVVGQTIWAVPYLAALKVGQLSAISANAGTLTAGTMQTAAGTGQRVEISSSTNQLRAYDSSNNVVASIGGSSNGSVFADGGSSSYPVMIYGKSSGGWVGVWGNTLGANGPISAGVRGTSSNSGAAAGYFDNSAAGGNGVYCSGRFNIPAMTGGNGTAAINSVVPVSNNTYNCGDSSFAWKDMYTVNPVTVTSDVRKKKDVADTDLGMNLVRLIPWKKWRWIESERIVTHMTPGEIIPGRFVETGALNGDGEPLLTMTMPVQLPATPNFASVTGERFHYGALAQDVRAALEKLGITNSAIWCLADKNNPDSTQMLRMGELIGVMGRAIQEIDERLTKAGI